MNEFEQASQRLVEAIKAHDSVIAFQKIEQKVKSYPELKHLAHQMKAYQQDSVLFQKIDKVQAQEQAEQEADKLQKELSGLPLVQDYRQKMQDASDLIQYVTKTLEERINEELMNGK